MELHWLTTLESTAIQISNEVLWMSFNDVMIDPLTRNYASMNLSTLVSVSC